MLTYCQRRNGSLKTLCFGIYQINMRSHRLIPLSDTSFLFFTQPQFHVVRNTREKTFAFHTRSGNIRSTHAVECDLSALSNDRYYFMLIL